MLVLTGPRKPVLSLTFAPDAAKLYALYDHAKFGIHVWNLADSTLQPLEIDGKRLFGELIIHPGGRWAFGKVGGQSSLIDLSTGRTEPFNFLGAWRHVALAPDGERVVTIGNSGSSRHSSEQNPCLCGWKITATGLQLAWEHESPKDVVPKNVIYAGNDTLVTNDNTPHRYSHLGILHDFAIRSAKDGEVQTTFDITVKGYVVVQLLASSDGTKVVARCGTSLWAWNAADQRNAPKVVEGKDSFRWDLRAAAFHPSGQYLLLAGNNGQSVTVFDTSTWKPVRRWNWKSGVLRTIAISPDGTLAAAAGLQGTVVVWDLDL